MITIWALVYFMHDIDKNLTDDQVTLSIFSSKADCEVLRNQATAMKPELKCIGIVENKLHHTDFRMKYWA